VPSEDQSGREPQNTKVPPDGPRGDVEIVQALHLLECQFASARDLQSPVMPGRTSNRRCADPSIALDSAGMNGRGPTRDMSPRNTLNSCGASSRLVFLKKTPDRGRARICPDLEQRAIRLIGTL